MAQHASCCAWPHSLWRHAYGMRSSSLPPSSADLLHPGGAFAHALSPACWAVRRPAGAGGWKRPGEGTQSGRAAPALWDGNQGSRAAGVLQVASLAGAVPAGRSTPPRRSAVSVLLSRENPASLLLLLSALFTGTVSTSHTTDSPPIDAARARCGRWLGTTASARWSPPASWCGTCRRRCPSGECPYQCTRPQQAAGKSTTGLCPDTRLQPAVQFWARLTGCRAGDRLPPCPPPQPGHPAPL